MTFHAGGAVKRMIRVCPPLDTFLAHLLGFDFYCLHVALWSSSFCGVLFRVSYWATTPSLKWSVLKAASRISENSDPCGSVMYPLRAAS